MKILNEELDKIKRLMGIREINEDVTSIDNTASKSGGELFLELMEEVATKKLEPWMEKKLEQTGLISSGKILYNKATSTIEKIEFAKLDAAELSLVMRQPVVRESMRSLILKVEGGLETLSNNVKFRKMIGPTACKLIDSYVAETANTFTKPLKDVVVTGVKYLTNKVYTFFTENEFAQFVNTMFRNAVGKNFFYKLLQKTINGAEATALRKEGEQLLEEYNNFLTNNGEGGNIRFDTTPWEERIYNYLTRVRSLQDTLCKKIWDELSINMPEEVRKNLLGWTDQMGMKRGGYFNVKQLKKLIGEIETLDPNITAQWTGWFQGFASIFTDLFSFKFGNFFRRVVNMSFFFETRLKSELLGNLKTVNGSLAKAFIKESLIRVSVGYAVYPAFRAGWETTKELANKELGHPLYIGGWGEFEKFRIVFAPKESFPGLEPGKGQQGAASGIVWSQFKKHYNIFKEEANLSSLFWSSPVWDGYRAYMDDAKTSEKNINEVLTDADMKVQQLKKENEKAIDIFLIKDKTMTSDEKIVFKNNQIRKFDDSVKLSRQQVMDTIAPEEIK